MLINYGDKVTKKISNSQRDIMKKVFSLTYFPYFII